MMLSVNAETCSPTPSVDEIRAAKGIVKVISHANEWLIIASGALDSRIYLQPGVVEELRDFAIEKKKDIRVLVGPKPDEKTLKELRFLWDRIYVLQEEPCLHFAIADGSHVRYEGRHESKSTPKNCVALNQCA